MPNILIFNFELLTSLCLHLLVSTKDLQDNVSLKNMDTSSLLDILHRPSQSSGPQSFEQTANDHPARPKSKSSSLKSLMEGVEELWDNTEYAEEFSVDNYLQKLA